MLSSAYLSYFLVLTGQHETENLFHDLSRHRGQQFPGLSFLPLSNMSTVFPFQHLSNFLVSHIKTNQGSSLSREKQSNNSHILYIYIVSSGFFSAELVSKKLAQARLKLFGICCPIHHQLSNPVREPWTISEQAEDQAFHEGTADFSED